ncbi:MAG TPA: hypothetical protein VHD36_17635 [Pirellulales bacterium]|nr:hypothetical protein [Pirellulales bacterium]
MAILIQFVLRLAFGMAAAMTLVPPRQVTSGYYRNNLYVLLGLNALAALAIGSSQSALGSPWPAIIAAVLSYVGAVAWLYEHSRLGLALLTAIAATDLAAAWLAIPATESMNARLLVGLDPATGGLVLGTTMAAMLLGHWYLNAPGMPLAPLVRLIGLLSIAVLLRALVCAAGLGLEIDTAGWPDVSEALFLGMRWLGGLVGTAILAWMAWQTLKVPNTQSATGILYVAVITTFLGELASGLLSAQAAYPL